VVVSGIDVNRIDDPPHQCGQAWSNEQQRGKKATHCFPPSWEKVELGPIGDGRKTPGGLFYMASPPLLFWVYAK
jgi:hypothetical protein